MNRILEKQHPRHADPSLTPHLIHDLRTASVHEAAHVMVARHYGSKTWAYVAPTNTSAPLEERSFIGRTGFEAGLSDHQVKMICLAGSVAEACDGDPDLCGWDLFDYLQESTVILSDSDAAGAGIYTIKDLDECIALVRRLWPAIVPESENLAAAALKLFEQISEAA